MATKTKGLPKHYFRRIMPGQTYAGRQYDQGEAVELGGGGNDAKLLKLGYVAEWPKDTEPYECGGCGKLFVEEQYRRRHGDFRHRGRALPGEETPVDDALEEAQITRMAQQMDKEVPFFLEGRPEEIQTTTLPVTIPATETPVTA